MLTRNMKISVCGVCIMPELSGIHTIMLSRDDSIKPKNETDTVNPLYNGIRYNSKIRYYVNPICTKISGSCIFSLTVLCYSLGKYMFWIFIRIASLRRF